MTQNTLGEHKYYCKKIKLMKKNIKRTRLLPINWEKHPFLYGLFSLGDMGGNNNLFNEPQKSDAEFLREDWARIGVDMKKAMTIYGKEIGLC